uniref:Uncharacterized protein n=1 Tax=viral metagenome TaxID=1070528 RepID=A0A6M3IP53_9ZZZZ
MVAEVKERVDKGVEWLEGEIGERGGGDYIVVAGLRREEVIQEFRERLERLYEIDTTGSVLEDRVRGVRIYFASEEGESMGAMAVKGVVVIGEIGETSLLRGLQRRLSLHRGRLLVVKG